MFRRKPPVVAFLLVALVAGCQKPRERRGVEALDSRAIRDNCYSLLYELLEEEKDVSKLRFIKREKPELKDFLKRVSGSAESAAKRLELFAKDDPTLALDYSALPGGEKQTRTEIANAKRKELLGEAGPRLELSLLLSQIEALNYASHLSKVAGEHETDSERAGFLLGASDDFERLRLEAAARLALIPGPSRPAP
jgi:hypothetical protein